VTVIGLIALSPAPAAAGVIYNNFGPGDSYNTILGHIVGPDGFGSDFAIGERFVAGVTDRAVFLTVAIGNVEGNSAVQFQLWTDVGGLPGSLLTTFDFNATAPFGSGPPPVTAVSDDRPLLTAGVNYWLVATSPGLNAWNFNSIGDVGLHGVSFDGGATFVTFDDTHGVFRIEPVPEPISIVLWMSAFGLGLAGQRWRRHAT
jgi:hypothetical protein